MEIQYCIVFVFLINLFLTFAEQIHFKQFPQCFPTECSISAMAQLASVVALRAEEFTWILYSPLHVILHHLQFFASSKL